MRKLFYLFAAATALFGEDRAFNRVPFDEWVKGGGEAKFKWSARIDPAHLSVHQRLIASVSVQLDGSEFVKRPKPGQLVVFYEFRDGDDRVFRTHSNLNFDELKNPADLAMVHLEQFLFVLPGDYRVHVAVYDRESKEHVLKRMKMHVPEIYRDPLAGSWHGLPAVEFVDMRDPPDRWFLPEITTRMNLPLKTEQPVKIEVLVNESPTEAAMGGRAGRTTRRNMSALIPALKVLSQIEVQNGILNISLLDLERRKSSFPQGRGGRIDWWKLKDAMAENDPNKIDVHALENHEQNAQFFLSEVKKRLDSVLIVLSGPMAFAKGQDLRPIDAEAGSKVFYIRYYPPRPPVQVTAGGPRGLVPGPPPPGARGVSWEDALVPLLKPLSPRRFDVTTAMEFRTAVAAILSDLGK